MIDIHTHIMPRMDDGSESAAESVEMLAESYAQGVRTIGLTSHCVIHREHAIDTFLDRRARHLEELKAEMANYKKPLPNLILGAEIYCDHDISQHEDIGKLCIENTNFLLMEFPDIKKFDWVAECIYALNVDGITPIIAHVDRYSAYETILSDFSDLDLIYEIHAAKFTSFFGRRQIKKILQRGKRFIVSSDMHNMGNRISKMQEAHTAAKKHFEKQADAMFLQNLADLSKKTPSKL